MIRFLLLTIALGLTAPAQAQQGVISDTEQIDSMSNDDLIAAADRLHPAVLYRLAGRLYSAGQGQEAAKWMYIAQLRYRILLSVQETSSDVALFGAMHEQVGRPINEYIGGNIDEWLGAIDAAVAWDAEHPNPLHPADDHGPIIDAQREGLLSLRALVEGRREEIPGLREETGLENR